jgi:hypothetical protein
LKLFFQQRGGYGSEIEEIIETYCECKFRFTIVHELLIEEDFTPKAALDGASACFRKVRFKFLSQRPVILTDLSWFYSECAATF